MVILSQNHTEKKIETTRFKECLNGYSRGRSAITGKEIDDLSNIVVPPMGVEIIDLFK